MLSQSHTRLISGFSPNSSSRKNEMQAGEVPVLYAQFLRDNVKIPELRNVRPEDIEDVSETYRPYLGVEFAADTVKKIRLRDCQGHELDTPLYLISLTEHKSRVDYENEELLERGDEMSLSMMFNKIQNTLDLTEFLKMPAVKLNEIITDTPNHIIEIIATVMKALCVKIGATEEETDRCIQKVRERKMGYLFENMEKMNIQEERRNTAEQRERAERAEERAVQLVVESCREFGATKIQTVTMIEEKFALSKEVAQGKVDLYWQT